MKVLHVLYQSLPQVSGSSIRSRDIMLSQKEVGIEVLAITAPFQNSISKKGLDIIDDITYIRTSQNTKNSITDLRKGVLQRIYRVFSILIFSQKLFSTIKKEKPDVLHAHAMFFCAIPSLVLGKVFNIPVVYEFRSLWMYQKTNSRNKGFINKKIEIFLIHVEIFCLKKAAHAVILNENLKEFIFSKTNKPFKNTIINNAVNTSLIEKLKASITPISRKDFVFGYVGTITEYEGLEFLIQTFQELYDDGFKHKLIIYGKGVNKQSVQDQIIARSDINTISYKGAIAPSEVYKAFSEIDVIINPRLNTPKTNSVTPLKPLEAMAYEKLFIGSDVRGIKEIVPQGTGFLFSSENKNDLKKVVKKVASLSPQDRNHHKKEALAFVVSHKSWLQNAAKYKEIYTTLCS
ncbi:glycosyltransferase [Flavobacteriaceae bacterium]|nr:glycosyltransferase [Flavobacteriaceae bacterium]